MIRIEPRALNFGHLGVVLRVTQPSPHGADVQIEGPLVAVEHRMLHPGVPGAGGTIRTHLQVDTYAIDDRAHTVIEMYGEDDQ